jgi:hypothetical protein
VEEYGTARQAKDCNIIRRGKGAIFMFLVDKKKKKKNQSKNIDTHTLKIRNISRFSTARMVNRKQHIVTVYTLYSCLVFLEKLNTVSCIEKNYSNRDIEM